MVTGIFLSLRCSQNQILKIGCTAAAVYGMLMFLKRWKGKKRFLKICKDFQLKNIKMIQSTLQKLDEDNADDRKKNLEMSAKDIIEAAKNSDISPVEIVRSYMYQACLVTQDLNCVARVIEDAEDDAKQVMDESCSDLKLFGLPVSIKENLTTKGMDCTSGLLDCVDSPEASDAVLIQVLKHCGAIPYVKTNLSHTTFSFESSNPLFGTTVHPLNKNFTPGGSSSGEGALVAAGGSILGFGTDTGGSIRCPSHLCGVAGFKPTTNRISSKGLKGLGGQTGPIAKKVDTLVLAMDALLCPLMFRLDPNVPPVPFNRQVYESKTSLRIGFLVDDGYCKPVPAIMRSVEIAKAALSYMGHTLVPFKIPRLADALQMFGEKVYGVAAHQCMKGLDFKHADPILHDLLHKLAMSPLTRWINTLLLRFQSRRMASDMRDHREITSVSQLLSVDARIAKYTDEFFDNWTKQDIDVVISPPYPVAACPLGSLVDPSGLWSYTALYNLLGYPAGVVPVTKVNDNDMNALKGYKGHYDDAWDKHIQKISENSHNMPVGVQCIALPFNDEVCLRVMKEIESAVKYNAA